MITTNPLLLCFWVYATLRVFVCEICLHVCRSVRLEVRVRLRQCDLRVCEICKEGKIVLEHRKETSSRHNILSHPCMRTPTRLPLPLSFRLA